VLAALRRATAARHAELDRTLAIGGAAPGLHDYRDHLAMLHAWLVPLEHWLAGYADGPQGPAAPPAVRRSLLIEADLAHPCMPPAAGAPAPQAPWPAGASAAYRWGVSYVIEGAQLGGAVLYQRLAGPLAPHPLDYLRGAPDGPGPRWRSFMLALRREVTDAHQIDAACAGACAAFDRILALRAHALPN